MGRIKRVVVPGIPHHIVHRGSRKEKIFHQDADYKIYISIMSKYIDRYKIEIWNYSLMPNHVHLMMVPKDKFSISLCIRDAHRQYSKYFNKKYNFKGHLWEARYGSYPVESSEIAYTAKYIERNPVAAKIVEYPDQFRWSSCQSHVRNVPDPLVRYRRILEFEKDWKNYVYLPSDKELLKKVD